MFALFTGYIERYEVSSHVLYSKKVLTDSERDFLLRTEEEIEYTCGGTFLPNNNDFLKHIVYLERKVNSCTKEISHQYYGGKKNIENFKLMCFNCLDEGNMAPEDDNFIKNFKAFKPRCVKCKEKGISSYQVKKSSVQQLLNNTENADLIEKNGGEESGNENRDHDTGNNKKRKTKHQSANDSELKDNSHIDGNEGEYIEEDRSSEENYQGISKMYVVENILQHKKTKGEMHLLIKWKGYAEETWEPEKLMRESIEEDVDNYFLQNRTSRKSTHKICEYDDCTLQSLPPVNCNEIGCNNKLHHLCQINHDMKYWKNRLEDVVAMKKVCYTCAKKELNLL